MSSRSPSNRGFLIVVEAAAAFIVLAVFSNLLVVREPVDLGDELVFQLAQDAAETCLAEKNFSHSCFDVLKKASPIIEYCLNDECVGRAPLIRRAQFNLSVWMKDD